MNAAHFLWSKETVGRGSMGPKGTIPASQGHPAAFLCLEWVRVCFHPSFVSHILNVLLLLLLLLSHFSRVWLCTTPYTVAHQALPSLGFSRQEHWSGLPFPSPMHESEKWKWSCVWLPATPWTAAHQAPPSMGFASDETHFTESLCTETIVIVCFCYLVYIYFNTLLLGLSMYEFFYVKEFGEHFPKNPSAMFYTKSMCQKFIGFRTSLGTGFMNEGSGWVSHIIFRFSVTQLCPTLCDPMDCSTQGFPVLHYLPEFAHVYWGGDAIQPSYLLPSPSPPALSLSQHQGLFQWLSSSCQVAKVLGVSAYRMLIIYILSSTSLSHTLYQESTLDKAIWNSNNPSNRTHPGEGLLFTCCSVVIFGRTDALSHDLNTAAVGIWD